MIKSYESENKKTAYSYKKSNTIYTNEFNEQYNIQEKSINKINNVKTIDYKNYLSSFNKNNDLSYDQKDLNNINNNNLDHPVSTVQSKLTTNIPIKTLFKKYSIISGKMLNQINSKFIKYINIF